MQVAANADNQDEAPSEHYIQFQGARVLWPPDCSDDTLTKSIEQARALLRNYDIDSEGLKISEELKKFMDRTYEPYWHVICGRNFGCYAIHEKRSFLFFYLGNIAFLMYKGG